MLVPLIFGLRMRLEDGAGGGVAPEKSSVRSGHEAGHLGGAFHQQALGTGGEGNCVDGIPPPRDAVQTRIRHIGHVGHSAGGAQRHLGGPQESVGQHP